MLKTEYNKILCHAKKLKSIDILGKTCQKCNESDIFKLCLHHINPNEKEYNWDDMSYMRWSIIEAELKNCMLLCNNCHVELHYNMKNINNNMLDIRKSKEILLSLKNYIGCIECGYNKCIAALEFHHLKDKSFAIGTKCLRLKDKSDISEYILNEVEKCDIICKNCHVKKSYDIEYYKNNNAIIMNKKNNIKESNKYDHILILNEYSKGKTVTCISKEFNINKGMVSWIIKKSKKSLIK